MSNFAICECGCDIFYIKQKISGFIYFNIGANGEEVYNGELYDNTIIKDLWKYYRCVDCGKRAVENSFVRNTPEEVAD